MDIKGGFVLLVTLAARVTLLAARVTLLAARVTLLAARVTLLAARVTLLAARVTLLAARVTLLAARVTLLAARVTLLAARVTLLAARVTLLAARVTLLAARVTLLDQQMGRSNIQRPIQTGVKCVLLAIIPLIAISATVLTIRYSKHLEWALLSNNHVCLLYIVISCKWTVLEVRSRIVAQSATFRTLVRGVVTN